MKRVNNENGAALVLTVMIITLLMVIVLGLFSQVTNTTRQITTMEKEQSAQLIAEMGIDYYRAILTDYVSESEFTGTDELIDYLAGKSFLKPVPFYLDTTENYQIHIIGPHIVQEEMTDTSVPISYTVKGVANGTEYETEDRIILITESEVE